ncbi:zinc transporter ZIP10-like [Ylistrum balloti]|uniref:zinc transporter ZIP10-like n=1 Tax=Ylistrum balloti TaxID=509963 RepID=UPI00290586BE|nr:zinc transporter ZIP10-like [Ylistrum balloti]
MEFHQSLNIAMVFILIGRYFATSEQVQDPKVQGQSSEKLNNITVNSFVDYIILKYSTDANVLSFEGYEHLLESLNLGMIHTGHHVETHIKNPSKQFHDFHENHNHQPAVGSVYSINGGHHSNEEGMDIKHHSNQNVKHEIKTGHSLKTENHNDIHVDHKEHSDHDGHPNHGDHGDHKDAYHTNRNMNVVVANTESLDFRTKCLTPLEILQLMNFTNQSLTKDQFIELFPLLIVQLEGHNCNHLRHHSHVHAHVHEGPKSNANSKTWFFACGAIVVISLSGLICVSLLSVLQHFLFENLLHFLVALAVGALTGDAMLHLLPHAFSSTKGHDHGDGHDMTDVYKGLAGLAVIYFFFLVGRIQNFAHVKRMKNKRQRSELDSVTATMAMKSQGEEDNMMVDKITSAKPEEADENHCHCRSRDGLSSSTGAMVWRVIVGDGIHNLSDGLAIGVAFAVSVTSGLSTSIAVLCHELPHEIGDFAVLLKKGMSIKQALCFNCLSSVLSMIGVLAGVAMGNITSVKFYILVCVAAMFIYISLVDMLPEISNSSDKNQLRHLVFTMLGMGVGSGIMLIIALKEEELMQLTT